MRTAPDVEPPRLHDFRSTRGVEDSAQDEQQAFEQVVWHAALLYHLGKTEELKSMY